MNPRAETEESTAAILPPIQAQIAPPRDVHRVGDARRRGWRTPSRRLQREVRHAMAAGQFHLNKQQIVDHRGGSAGAEILSRWHHPRRGVIEPREFLPAINAAGINEQFDSYVVERSLGAIAAQPSISQLYPLWINVSSESLTMRFVYRIVSQLEAAGLSPSNVVLELSENARAESAEAIDALTSLAASGLALAVDDFGVGYSRLLAMKELPVSFVKIDRAFTSGLTDDRSRKIVTALVDLVRATGAEPVAECVEHQADADVLADIGCNLMQGFLWSHPTPLCDEMVDIRQSS